MNSLLKKAWLLIIIILIADQGLKFWIKTNMFLDERISVAGDWFYLAFTENPGMAFGMLFGGSAGKIVLVLFRVILAGAIIWYIPKLIRSAKVSTGMVMVVAGICAGALGNIIDCAFYGLIFDTGTTYNATVDAFVGYSGVSNLSANGYASLLQGCVVDMFYFPIIETTLPQWLPFKGGEEFIFFSPIFNVADAAISVSIFYAILFERKSLNIILSNKKISE